jgi:hypothetical protein
MTAAQRQCKPPLAHCRTTRGKPSGDGRTDLGDGDVHCAASIPTACGQENGAGNSQARAERPDPLKGQQRGPGLACYNLRQHQE